MFLDRKLKYSRMSKRGDDMFGLGVGELVLVVLILMLFFGPKKLPQLGKGIGEAIREFKKAGSELRSDSDKNQRNS
jgi:sec-independent protein translocase protein TatA